MFVSKCKITLSLYHYCVASLPTDTIKIIITHFSINVKDTAKAHTYTHTHTFTITHSKLFEIKIVTRSIVHIFLLFDEDHVIMTLNQDSIVIHIYTHTGCPLGGSVL